MSDPAFLYSDGTTVRLLHFEGQRQAQGTWCWAAVASSIELFFLRKNRMSSGGVAHPQCYFVSRQHRRFTCRDGNHAGFRDVNRLDCKTSGCSLRGNDETGRLDAAIAYVDTPPKSPTGLYHDGFFERARPYPVAFDEIKTEIDKGEPMIIRVARPDRTFHLMVIVGYDDSLPGVILWDPAYGERMTSYNRMQIALGTWTHTLWTQDWLKWIKERYSDEFSP